MNSNQYTNVVDRKLAGYQARSTPMLAAQEKIRQNPRLSVAELSREMRCTPRHLRRLFREDVGITPKDYIQLVRVGRILHHLEHGNRGKLTDLAYELGFSDQAHLTRVFKQFTGHSPRGYLGQGGVR